MQKTQEEEQFEQYRTQDNSDLSSDVQSKLQLLADYMGRLTLAPVTKVSTCFAAQWAPELRLHRFHPETSACQPHELQCNSSELWASCNCQAVLGGRKAAVMLLRVGRAAVGGGNPAAPLQQLRPQPSPVLGYMFRVQVQGLPAWRISQQSDIKAQPGQRA